MIFRILAPEGKNNGYVPRKEASEEIFSKKSCIMKVYFLIFLVFLFSCEQTKNTKLKDSTPYKNVYSIFDEPSSNYLKQFDYYLLITEKESFGNLFLTSVRIKENSGTCYYKIVQNDNIPPISNMIKSDTISFPFLSYFIKMSNQGFDSIKLFTSKLNLMNLKDTTIGNHVDGVRLDIIISVNGVVKAIHRSVPSMNEVESEIKELLQNIKHFTVNKLVVH